MGQLFEWHTRFSPESVPATLFFWASVGTAALGPPNSAKKKKKKVLHSVSFAALEFNLHGLSANSFSLTVHNVCPF